MFLISCKLYYLMTTYLIWTILGVSGLLFKNHFIAIPETAETTFHHDICLFQCTISYIMLVGIAEIMVQDKLEIM